MLSVREWRHGSRWNSRREDWKVSERLVDESKARALAEQLGPGGVATDLSNDARRGGSGAKTRRRKTRSKAPYRRGSQVLRLRAVQGGGSRGKVWGGRLVLRLQLRGPVLGRFLPLLDLKKEGEIERKGSLPSKRTSPSPNSGFGTHTWSQLPEE